MPAEEEELRMVIAYEMVIQMNTDITFGIESTSCTNSKKIC